MVIFFSSISKYSILFSLFLEIFDTSKINTIVFSSKEEGDKKLSLRWIFNLIEDNMSFIFLLFISLFDIKISKTFLLFSLLTFNSVIFNSFTFVSGLLGSVGFSSGVPFSIVLFCLREMIDKGRIVPTDKIESIFKFVFHIFLSKSII
ncbi:hypothetical protein NWE59_03420 [Mycoplasmopsis felis]|uniref:hypothetical protein n=1 Tax=Mycoplasmopsis felis TaxID=33923 RepID=UPI0021AF71A8|nr:hypothetical protein [Mycoplasmopsis felis]UWV78014.1 hypothetical protein NWE59_03420 [Mycoplasmopsis felis]